MDTWQHFISLLESSKFKNLEFDTKNNIFARDLAISHEHQQFHMVVRDFKLVGSNKLECFSGPIHNYMRTFT